MKNTNAVYVVSWAGFDGNQSTMTSGMFREAYATYRAAMDAVEKDIDQIVDDDMHAFDEADYEDVYGTSDREKIKESFICRRSPSEIVVMNPNTDYETQYTIRCYSPEFAK